MSIVMKYNLQQFNTIAFNGFQYSIPQTSIDIINDLTTQVGSTAHVKTNLFLKKTSSSSLSSDKSGFNGDNQKTNNKKKKGNKSMEMSNDEWETLRTFQATKIEHKTGIDSDIDQIRLYLNKLSDKTFLEMKEKLFEIIDTIVANENFNNDYVEKINSTIYDISASNKFYSKIYASLYVELLHKYGWIRDFFQGKLDNYIDNFNDIEFFDPEKNYDKFCEMNKRNEIRKAHTQFIVNIAMHGYISKLAIAKYLRELVVLVISMINANDKKNEVDELTENIAILYSKDMLEEIQDLEDYDEDMFLVNGDSIYDTITVLAKCKVKDYKSLSNKAIFKYMDLIEI